MTHRPTEPGGFDPAEVQRVMDHMNRCHPEENALLGELAAGVVPERVWVTGFDQTGVDLLAEFCSGPAVLRLDYQWPALTVGEAGEELRRLYRTACRSVR